MTSAPALSDLQPAYSGKVRDVYDLGEHLLLVTSDRVSTYDCVHPNLIPDKGKVLNGITVSWFDQTKGIVPNHLVSATDGVPDEVRGRAVLARKLEMFPVECVARGYLTGSGWVDYPRRSLSRRGLSTLRPTSASLANRLTSGWRQ